MTDFAHASAAKTASESRNRLQRRMTLAFIFLTLASFIVLEASLPRMGERRLNFPLFFGMFVLMAPALAMGFRTIRQSALPLAVLATWVVYTLWTVMSFYWSIAPGQTILFSAFGVFLIIIAVGAAKYSVEDTVTVFIWATGAICLASWIAFFVAPGYALQEKGIWRLRGVMEHEFRLGYICAASLIFYAVRLSRRMRWGTVTRIPVPLMMLILGTLYATQTRTLLAYTLLCVALVLVLNSRGRTRLLIAAGALACAVAGYFLMPSIVESFSRGEGDATLSGRTFVWEQTLSLAQAKPWEGFGFASFLNPYFDHFWNSYRAPHAHNAWLQAYFETGRIGATLLIASNIFTLIAAIWLAIKSNGYRSYSLFLFIFVTLSSLTGLVFGGKVTTLTGILLLILLQENYALKRDRTSSKARSNSIRQSRISETPPATSRPDRLQATTGG